MPAVFTLADLLRLSKHRTLRVVGAYYRIACEEMFPVVGAIHLPMLGWSPEEAEVLFAKCRSGMRDPNVHAYGLMHFWSGQKPLDAGPGPSLASST